MIASMILLARALGVAIEHVFVPCNCTPIDTLMPHLRAYYDGYVAEPATQQFYRVNGRV